jgi:RNA polymerase sigma factor (sigma-70 family)
MNRVLHSLRRAALRCADNGMTDRQLLERFLTEREEAAFEALLRRHGPMVLGVCRRVLDGLHDAEDAFQATFLVLVRKASSIAQRDTVGNWLYGVAYRTAQKARVAAAKRRMKEKQVARPEALPEEVWQQVRPLLDLELNRLPDKYREPIVLCDLEGATRKEAAQRLGWPEGTLSGRLSRARQLLARRLARHGLTLSVGAVAGALSGNAALAAVPAPLVSSTVRAAALVAVGPTTTGALSAPVAALLEGVLHAMLMTKMKTAFTVVMAVGLLAAGFAVCLSHTTPAPAAQAPPPAVGSAPQQKVQPPEQAATNLPMGPAPVQILVSVNEDHKLVVKTAITTYRFPGGGPGNVGPNGGAIAPPPVALPGPGGAPGGFGGTGKMEAVNTLRSQVYDLEDVHVFDTNGNKINKKQLAKLLKEETVAMAVWGQTVDPLHLRVLKEGTLTFALPAPQGFGPGMAPPAVPVPQPAGPAGGGIKPPAIEPPAGPVGPGFPSQPGGGGNPAGPAAQPPGTPPVGGPGLPGPSKPGTPPGPGQ